MNQPGGIDPVATTGARPGSGATPPLRPVVGTEEPASNFRWYIVAMLVGFSMVSYIERMNISVAAKFMMPEFGLSQVQMGQVFSAFLLGYSLFQIPMGMLGDRVGPRFVLSAIAWCWAILTFLTGFVPGRVFGVGIGAFVVLLVIRFALGVSIAGVYPVSARAMAMWQPLSRRAFSYSFVIAGVSIGSAVTPPAVAWLMLTLGWRQSFYLAALLSVAIAIIWMRYGADSPQKHTGVNPAELRLITAEHEHPQPGDDRPPGKRAWLRALRSPSLAFLCASYFLFGYVLYTFVFWFFIYLVDVRKFSILSSGIFASMPFIAAGVLAPIGGGLCDRATVRLGRHWGRRCTGIAGPLIAATFLIVGARTDDPLLAVAALSLSFGFQMFAEGAVWATTMDIGGRMTGMATGIINTANNLGGVVSTALMPVLVAHFGWVTALDSCAAVAILAAILWLGVRPEEPIEFMV